MPAIVNTNLAGFTVTYNGVQFGGNDAAYKSLPPFYALRGQFRYDDSDRSVIATDYTLLIKCVFFEDTEGNMSFNMNEIRKRLCQPGYKLQITGLGLGFNIDADPAVDGVIVADVTNGPGPEDLSFSSLGKLAWELSWTVRFSLCECASSGLNPLAFLAFNFDTTWANDFEGLCTRTITGHVLIAQNRGYLAPALVAFVADNVRGNVLVYLPPYFRRTANVWKEGIDKSRLDFTIVDEQIEGDFLPAGITDANGSLSFSAGDGTTKGAGMAQGIVTLAMSLKTAPNQPRNLAGQIFLAAALSQQSQMTTSLATAIANDGSLPPSSAVVPVRLAMANGKFNRARQTDASMTWIATHTLQTILNASGIFTPIAPNDYTLWAASMATLWDNRGQAQMASQANEAVILDLCDNITAKTLGFQAAPANNPNDATLPSLSCPTIPDTGGWIHFDIDIRVLRKDHQTRHRKASIFSPSQGSSITDPKQTDSISQGSDNYTQSNSDQLVTEYHGFPETLIGLTFSALRFKNKPFVPEIKSIAGLTATKIDGDSGVPRIVFDAFGCPIWAVSGYRVYSVPGYVPSTKSLGSVISYAAGLTPTQLLEL